MPDSALLQETPLDPEPEIIVKQPEEEIELVYQTVPDELLTNILARFTFDKNVSPAEPVLQAIFARASASALDGESVPEQQPRLVEGRFGKGLLLEDAHLNLLTRNQAAVEGSTTSSFECLKGAIFSYTTNEAWQGQQALQVDTPGQSEEEGIAVKAQVPRAVYDGQRVVPAHYNASVWLKGQGSLLLLLKEELTGIIADPVQVNLKPDQWQRFYCFGTINLPAQEIGPDHESDWQQLLAEEVSLNTKLILACVTADRRATTFYTDGFQLEQRALPFAGHGHTSSPRSWAPAGLACAPEEFSVALKGLQNTGWRENGAISFWFKPAWHVRDGTQEHLLGFDDIPIKLCHRQARLEFMPTGATLSPFDWKDTWHHIALSWNETGRFILYVDGYDYGRGGDMGENALANVDAIQFSTATPGGAPNGILDELIFFNGELTLEQVKAISAYEPSIITNQLTVEKGSTIENN